MDKIQYKKAISAFRKQKQKPEDILLLDMIINLKSWNHGILTKEMINQLKLIMKGTKSKTGDVYRYFWENYNLYVKTPSPFKSVRYYGSRLPFKQDKNGWIIKETYKEDELPF